MKHPRREFLRLARAPPRCRFCRAAAFAQAYPSRPVRMIVGFAAGSAPDIIARLIGQWLSDQLGQPFVIDNRPGAASNIGTEAAVRAAPDGYTLQMTVLTNVFNTTLYTNLNFNFVTDVAHVAGVANAPYVVIVPPSFPAKTIPEFIAYAKANPGKINMASGGNGSSSHIFGELFKAMAGVDLQHVPYRGVYMNDLISGQVQVVVNPIPQALELIRTGKLRALGGDHAQAPGGAAGHSDRRRIRAGLRGDRLVWPRHAQEHAGRDRRTRSTKRPTRRWPIPSSRSGWPPRRRADADDARRVRQVRRHAKPTSGPR